MGKVAILGLGPSKELFNHAFDEYSNVIGVNDIWRYYKTDAIVCLDYPRVFRGERLKTIESSKPEVFYSQLVIWDTRPDFQKINIAPGYPDTFCDINGREYRKSYCSPFVACQVAYKIYKATEIHLYGVDMTNHPHLDKAICKKIVAHFANLKKSLEENRCKLVIHGSGILTVLL